MPGHSGLWSAGRHRWFSVSTPVPSSHVRRQIHIATDRFPGKPDFDAAVSRAVLHQVAAGDLPETLRLFIPERLVAFGSRDAVNPAFATAQQMAAAEGFGSYRRLAGGKAAVFHEHTIAFAWAIPSSDPSASIAQRFDETDDIITAALGSLGVDARVGEVPGEYCPGANSINAGGRYKLAGIGQRLIAGAAHVGGVIVADRADLVNRALVPVYDALGYTWDPATTGSVSAEVDTDVAAVMAAVRGAFEARHDLTDGPLGPATLDAAAAAEADPPPQR